jgi:hypothetical protein
MSTSKEQRDALKATLKKLRDERGTAVDAAIGRNKIRQAVRKQVRAALVVGQSTVPALAAATGLPTRDVLWHVAAMRKYGQLVEDGQDGDYCLYRLTPKDEGSD